MHDRTCRLRDGREVTVSQLPHAYLIEALDSTVEELLQGCASLEEAQAFYERFRIEVIRLRIVRSG